MTHRFFAILTVLGIMLSFAALAEEKQIVISAPNAIVISGETGEILYEHNADEHIYPASTTKILTVFLGALIGDSNSSVTISQKAVRMPDDAMRIGFEAGEVLPLKNLLLATLVQSGNDGANAIAESVSGSIPAFVDLMNQYVVSIGCTDTHFTNPSGLHDENHFTSARDMALITFEAMNNEAFRELSGIGRYNLPPTNLREAQILTSHGRAFFENKNSDYYYPGACGIKTGYHSEAGYCFIACAEKNGHTLIAAVFGCTSYGSCFSNAKSLLDYGFGKIQNQ